MAKSDLRKAFLTLPPEYQKKKIWKSLKKRYDNLSTPKKEEYARQVKQNKNILPICEG